MSDYLESLTTEISPGAPSGSDLEYDPEFARMEKAAQGTPDQEFGSTRIDAQPPDWAIVRQAALDVLARSHDLRAATYLAQAELVLRGLSGLRDALRLSDVFVNDFWDTVYPQLDPDDDNDPTIRANALQGLSNVGGLIRQLRITTIVSSRSVGNFSWTDCAIARGELPVPAGKEDPPTQKQIDAAVQSCDVNALDQLHQCVEECLQSVSAIESGFTDRLGYGTGPNFELLTKELKNISKTQKVWLLRVREADAPAPTVPASSDAQEPSDGNGDHGVTAIFQPHVTGAASFHIARREDAVEGLDKIIRWFERFEPSSPLPMLLRRARRLSTMGFLDILRDISPDGISQALLVGGAELEELVAAAPAPAASAKSTPSTEQRAPVNRVLKDDEY